MNGIGWRIVPVCENSEKLIDRTGTHTVATTDPSDSCVYISDKLQGKFKTRVLIHELSHCALFSFNLLAEVHKMVTPPYWIEAEEWICNYLADYGEMIFDIAYRTLGNEAIWEIPKEIEKLIT